MSLLRINHQDFLLTVHRSKRRRRSVALMIKPDGEVRILAPVRTSNAWINAIIQRRTPWIRDRLAKLRQRLAKTDHQWDENQHIQYAGKSYALRLTHDEHLPAGCTLNDDVLIINIPEHNLSAVALNAEIKCSLLLWYKKQARQAFAERMEFWANQMGVTFRRMMVSNPRRQWGSCSAKNDIRLSWRLILTPPALLDYVIVHELCHVRHKNHSRHFWNAVANTMPDYQTHRSQLRGWETPNGL